jgi:glycosyltransferase involved in cell wall biosynthesis
VAGRAAAGVTLFSIVIPTCERAHLLSSALESVLDGQRFDDYEVVVSDNFSSDDTAGTVARYSFPRLRYVRTDRRLSMADHWEFALGHARGDYVSYLCDDDAWTPEVLDTVASTIARGEPSLVAMFRGRYFASNCSWPGWENSLSVAPFTGKTFERDSRETLRALFRYQETMRMPKMFNSFCDRRLLEKASKRWGRLFLPWCPDYSFPAIMLTETESWTLIDRPLWLRYFGEESIGSGARDTRGGPFQRFLEEHGAERLPRRTPLRLPVASDYAVDTLLSVKELRPESFQGVDVDWERYFVTCWKELGIQERGGAEVSELRDHFGEVLARRDADFQRRVRAEIEDLVYDELHRAFVRRTRAWSVKKALTRFAVTSAFVRFAAASWHRLRGMNPGGFVRGTDGSFTSILEAARRVTALVGR